MGEKLYQHLERNGLLVDEQKGCRRGTLGTKDQLPLKNCQRRLTNLSMAWIDYKRDYDVVPHLWILKCLEMVGTAKNMISIFSNSMVNWKTVLTSGGVELGQVDIRRGIFQGDSLLPLLFIVVMLPLTLVLRKMTAVETAKDTKPINHLLFMDELKLYGAMTIFTDRQQHKTLIDIVAPADQNILTTKDEKVAGYQDIALKIKRVHGATKVAVIPIVIGALGTISEKEKTQEQKNWRKSQNNNNNDNNNYNNFIKEITQ